MKITRCRNKSEPIVSVFVFAYNHQAYLGRCLDGIVSQQTNFPFEVIVHDDASTDETSRIIEDYQQTYPDLITVIQQSENQFSKCHWLHKHLLPEARGKYIALVEGDDYWVNPSKLELQYRCLEENKQALLCVHPVEWVDFSGNPLGKTTPISKKYLTLEDCIVENPANYCSYFLRRSLLEEFPRKLFDLKLADWPIILIAAFQKEIPCVGTTMGAYRVHATGLWATKPFSFRATETAKMWIRMAEAFPERLGDLERGLCVMTNNLSILLDQLETELNGIKKSLLWKIQRKVWLLLARVRG